MAGSHEHRPAARKREPDEGGVFDWFRLLDVLVWVSVVLIVILGVEWLAGTMVRERIARGAQKHLAAARSAAQPES